MSDYTFSLNPLPQKFNHKSQIIITSPSEKIGKYAFSNCQNLSLYVPPQVTQIGKYAFGNGTKDQKKIKMLYCVKRSAAYKFAKKNSIPYTLVKSNKASKRKVESITPSSKSITLKAGKSKTLSYKIAPFYASNKTVKFTSSNKERNCDYYNPSTGWQ